MATQVSGPALDHFMGANEVIKLDVIQLDPAPSRPAAARYAPGNSPADTRQVWSVGPESAGPAPGPCRGPAGSAPDYGRAVYGPS
jgi:hypothetical protein